MEQGGARVLGEADAKEPGWKQGRREQKGDALCGFMFKFKAVMSKHVSRGIEGELKTFGTPHHKLVSSSCLRFFYLPSGIFCNGRLMRLL